MNNNGNFLLGLILIVVGGFWIAGTIGLVEMSLLYVLLKFWPVLLILAGINIIFKGNKGVLLLSVILVLSGGLYLAQNDDYNGITFYNWSFDFNKDWNGEAIETIDGTYDLEELETVTLDLEVGAGDIDIKSTNSDKMEYSIPDYFLSRNFVRNDEDGTITIKHNKGFKINAFGKNSNLNYDFELPDDKKWTIKLETGASDAKLDLSDLLVETVDIDTGASDTELKLGDKSDYTFVDIDSGVSDVTISVKEDTGVRIKSSQAISGNNFEAEGLSKKGGVYLTKGYDKADTQVEIEIDAGISDITLEFY